MKHKILISIIVIVFKFLGVNNLYAQEIKPLVRIPFTTNGKQTFLEVQINDSKESLCFVFDTGAGSTVLDKDLSSSYITVKGEKEEMTTSAEVVKVEVATNNKIKLNGFEIEGIKFYMANLSHLKPATNGKKVVGIIGFDMLKNFVSYINHEKNYIELYPQGTPLYPKAKQLPFYLYEDELPAFRATIQTENGKEYPVQLIFDSGAGFTSSLSTNFISKHKLDSDLKVKIKIPVIGGNLSSNAINYLSSLKKISFSGFTFNHIPVNFSTSTSGALATDSIDGVIGFELIKRFNTVLDYENKIIKLIPNKYYKSPFDFNLTGLNFRPKENQIIVSSVFDFSPAKNAGIKQDDIIISVDNKKFSTPDKLKNYLKNSYRIKKIKIKRDNDIMSIAVKPANFY